jgi:transcriptional regulator with XRE-family HTH domain
VAEEPPPHHRLVVARNLRQARERAGMTQEALGWAAGLHPTEIGRLESGTRNAGLDTLVKVARGLDLSVSDLVRGL